jgi:hypothetical protein
MQNALCLGVLSVATLCSVGGERSEAAGLAAGPRMDVERTESATGRQGATPPGPVYPLRPSANNRYLVDQNNVPFLIAGDSPQLMIEAVPVSDADQYMTNRQGLGFNALWIHLVGGYVNGSTFDGIPPFTVEGDLSTPNEAYFARADAMIRLAAAHQIVVFLDPIETADWLVVLRSNGIDRARNYGRYVGNRYRDFDNIVWLNGNDFDTWEDPNDDALVQAVALGIKDNDSRHIHTVELGVPISSSLDDPAWAPICGVDAAYTYAPTYAQVIADYNRPNFMPTFLVEANYEFENNTGQEYGDAFVLRLQEYRAQLSGATGQLYGNHYTYSFEDDWRSYLLTPGATQFGYLKNLLASRRWYDLVPDQTHTFVTAGYGTLTTMGPNRDSDYLTAEVTPDGAFGIAYTPSIRPFTVNMARMSGLTNARWFDPASGVFVAIAGSPFPNVGSVNFSPPGPNGDGDGDWALLLEVTSSP